MPVFCTSKLFTPYHHCKIFWATIFLCNTPLQQGSFISLYLVQEQEQIGQQQRQCQRLVRKRKGVRQQQELVNGINANQRSNEVVYSLSDLMGHAEGRACLSED